MSTDGAECPCSSSSISLVGQLSSSSPHGNLATKRTLSMSVRGVALRLAMGRVGSGGIDLNAKAPDALGLGSQYVLLAQLRRERVYVHFVIETAHRCQADGPCLQLEEGGPSPKVQLCPASFSMKIRLCSNFFERLWSQGDPSRRLGARNRDVETRGRR